VIDVVDNGIGLPKIARARLLEPYVTTRAKGTGLGLAIVGRVLEDHGGRIELKDAADLRPASAGVDAIALCHCRPCAERRNQGPAVEVKPEGLSRAEIKTPTPETIELEAATRMSLRHGYTCRVHGAVGHSYGRCFQLNGLGVGVFILPRLSRFRLDFHGRPLVRRSGMAGNGKAQSHPRPRWPGRDRLHP